MTVAQSTRQSGPWTATAGQTVFNYDFPVGSASEIKVVRTRDVSETELELDVDYGVTHVGEPQGTIILTAGSEDGDVLLIDGDLPIERVTNFQGFRSIPNNTINFELDRMTKSLQEMRRDVDSSIHSVQAGTAYDIHGSRLVHVADGIEDSDAATVGQLKPFADAAAAAAQAAQDARDAAAASNEDASGSRDIATAAAEAAELARAAAEAAAEGVTLPAVTANTMLVDNALGTLRETKTFPQVRALLRVPSFEDLSYVDASQNGVPGDNTDQTAALQAIIDGLPAEGGNVLLKGNVNWTQLSAADRRNIRFIGLGGYGAGAQQNTRFRCIAGALGNGVSAFNLKRTMNVSFEKMFIDSRDAAFTGTLLDWGDLTSGSALMSMIDCYLNVLSNVSGARGINLYGATQGVFDRVKFAGARTLIQMQNAPGVGWCNQHTFRACSLNPSGSSYPVAGSGEGITFQGCNVQASSGDGIGRFWSTELTQDFRCVSLIGNTFYDVLTTGGVWCNFYTGQGLLIMGNMLGGAANVTGGNNYGIFIGGGQAGVLGAAKGVSGVSLFCNSGRYMSALFGFNGTKANYNNVRNVRPSGNYAFGSLTPSGTTVLYTGAAQLEDAIFDPSECPGAPFSFGTHFNVAYLPHYVDRAAAVAAGHQTGDVFISTASPFPVLTV